MLRNKFEYSAMFGRMVRDFVYKRRAPYFNCKEGWKYKSDNWSLEKDIESVMSSVEMYDSKYALPLSLCYKISGSVVLDVVCGWGAFEVSIAKRGGFVVGIEIDKDAIKLAKALVREHNVEAKVSLVISDARRLPFRNEIFGCIVSFGVFEHIPKVELAIKECWRVLKKGGTFFFETPNRLFPYDFHDTNLPFIHWLPHRVANSIARVLHRIDPSHMPQTSPGNFELNRYLTRREILKMLNPEVEIICPNWKIISSEKVGHLQWRHILRNVLEKSILFSPTLNMVIRRRYSSDNKNLN